MSLTVGQDGVRTLLRGAVLFADWMAASFAPQCVKCTFREIFPLVSKNNGPIDL